MGKSIVRCFCCLMILIGGAGLSADGGIIDIRNIVERYNVLSTDTLYEMGLKYAKDDRTDSALVCFIIVANRLGDDKNVEELKTICKSMHSAASIYYSKCDYDKSLELLLQALLICDKIGYDEFVSRVYNSIGNVHALFKEYDVSKHYFFLAYKNIRNEEIMPSILNNIGTLYCCENNFDSALYYLERSHKYYIKNNDTVLYKLFSNIGLINHRLYKFDTALYYYNEGLNNAIKLEKNDGIASILSNIGQMYYDMPLYDSALVYLTKSNEIAEINGNLPLVMDNYKYLSLIEERLHNYRKALEYDRKYVLLNDSIYNVSKYSNINEKQFIYEMSKFDQQIKEMSAEQALRENKIIMQRRTQVAMIIIILIAAIFLVILFRKNSTLNNAYNKLATKTLEIVQVEKSNKQIRQEYEETIRIQKEHIDRLTSIVEKENSEIVGNDILKRVYPLKDEDKNNILSAIENVMEDSSVFCNSDFSLEILANMINSNSNYVSQVINDTFGKNFRAYINEYRIKEALRLLSSSEHSRYSIETISEMVGFKSKSTFNKLFLKTTGVTPSFYFKSIHLKGE